MTLHEAKEETIRSLSARINATTADGYSEMEFANINEFPLETWLLDNQNKQIEMSTVHGHFEITAILVSDGFGQENIHQFDVPQEAINILKLVIQTQLMKLTTMGY